MFVHSVSIYMNSQEILWVDGNPSFFPISLLQLLAGFLHQLKEQTDAAELSAPLGFIFTYTYIYIYIYTLYIYLYTYIYLQSFYFSPCPNANRSWHTADDLWLRSIMPKQYGLWRWRYVTVWVRANTKIQGKHDMNKQHRIHMYAHCECWAICILIHLMHRFQLLRFCWRSILGIQLARAMVKTTGESSSSRLRTRDTRSGSTGTGWVGWI